MRVALSTPLALLLVALALPASSAFAADGLQINGSGTAPRWQARLQLSSLDTRVNSSSDTLHYTGSRLLSANLLGDYYLTGSGIGGVRGGLRATGGMLIGPLSLSQTSAGLALGSSALQLGSSLSVGQRSVSLLSPGLETHDPNTSLSYVGIGYSGHSLRGGWGFSADLGLISNTSIAGLRLGRSNAAGLEDVLRDLRYKPVLQLGLSYSY